MTEREALLALAEPEPDYFDDPAGWQEWRDRTTEALQLAETIREAV